MKILGIETSCDETAASVVENATHLLSNVVASSMDRHAQYGGVIPEIAARSHIEVIMPVIEQAVSDSGVNWEQIDGIAVTRGPGLGGSLLVGVLTARTLAIVKNKPLYGVNHVQAHPFATLLTGTSPSLSSTYNLLATAPSFPMLALIVSGGHSQLVLFRSPFDYDLLGQTRDDAIGEAFDKVAKIIGLPYPGGPSISKKALDGDAYAYKLPKAKLSEPYEFSFSGLKTAVLRALQADLGKRHDFPSIHIPELLSGAQRANMAASFQHVAVETVVDKTIRAYEQFQPKSVVVAGGVAANQELRTQLAKRLSIQPTYTDIKLCTDNGAMIAVLGCLMAEANIKPSDPYTLDISPSLSM